MPRTLLKVFGGWVVVVVKSEFSVHLWSEASALVWTKLYNIEKQDEAELGQAQLKLGLRFTSIKICCILLA